MAAFRVAVRDRDAGDGPPQNRVAVERVGDRRTHVREAIGQRVGPRAHGARPRLADLLQVLARPLPAPAGAVQELVVKILDRLADRRIAQVLQAAPQPVEHFQHRLQPRPALVAERFLESGRARIGVQVRGGPVERLDGGDQAQHAVRVPPDPEPEFLRRLAEVAQHRGKRGTGAGARHASGVEHAERGHGLLKRNAVGAPRAAPAAMAALLTTFAGPDITRSPVSPSATAAAVG